MDSEALNPKLVERLTDGESYLPGVGQQAADLLRGNHNTQYYLWYVAMSFFTFKAVNYISWLTVPGMCRNMELHKAWREGAIFGTDSLAFHASNGHKYNLHSNPIENLLYLLDF